MRAVTGALLAVLTFAALAVTPAAAGASPAQEEDEETASITLVGQSVVVDPDGVFTVEAKVSGAPAGADLTARIFNPVSSRVGFGRNLFEVGLGTPLRRSLPVPALEESPPLPDGSIPVTVTVPLCSEGACGADRLPLGTDGVYPFELRLLDADGDEITNLLTFMVRLPDDPADVTPMTTSFLFDRDAPPMIGPDGEASVSAEQLGPLVTMTNAIGDHPEVPVTISPTPEAVESIDLGTAATIDLLASHLRLSGSQVVAGTYVDVPVSAWLAGQLDRELGIQRARGTDALQKLPDPDVSTWVAEPTLNEPGAARLMELGVGQLVVDPGGLAVEEAGPNGTELLGPFEVEAGPIGAMPAVQIDPVLQGAFVRTGDPILIAHRIVAELATMAYEGDGDPRGVVVAPPADWEPNGAMLDIVLNALTEGRSLLRPVTIRDFFKQVPPLNDDGEPSDEDDARLRLRLAPASQPDLGNYPDRLRDARARLDNYSLMIGEGDRSTDRFNDLLLASGAVELAPAQRDVYLDGVVATLEERFKGVVVPDRQTVTLTSAEGQLPLTIRNLLDQDITVEIHIRSSERLEFPEDTIRVDLAANETRSVKLQVRARATGDTPIQVIVQTPGGGRLLHVTRYNVRSTAVSGVGLFLTVGAAGFLALWWLRHIRLVRRERRALAAEQQDRSTGTVALD